MKNNIEKIKISQLPINISDGNYSAKYPRAEEMLTSGVPFIRVNNIKNNVIVWDDMKFISEEKHSQLLKGHLKENDVLISVRGELGKVALVSSDFEDANINAQLANLRVIDIEKIDPKYLLYALRDKSVGIQIEQNCSGSTLKQLPITKLKEIQIPIQSIESQRKIAKTLDQAQELIDKRKAQIEALDELIQSVFYDMFGDPLINEKEWPRKCINEVVDYLKRGKSPKYVDYSNIRVINQKCIYWRKFIDSNCKYYNEDFEDKINDQYLQDKDILINSTGTGTLGRAVVLNVKEGNKFVADSHVTLMRVNRDCINPIFIATLFEFNNIQSEIYLKCVNGSTNQIELSVVKLGHYQVIIPPIELQNQFAEIVENIEKQKALLNESLVELENNFNSLMQRAFNGESLC